MGLIWGRQDPGGPHVGPMNFVIWENSTTRATQLLQRQFPLFHLYYIRLAVTQQSAALQMDYNWLDIGLSKAW